MMTEQSSNQCSQTDESGVHQTDTPDVLRPNEPHRAMTGEHDRADDSERPTNGQGGDQAEHGNPGDSHGHPGDRSKT